MIEIFIDQSHYDKYSYFESLYSSFDIINMDEENLKEALHSFMEHDDIHSCYDTLVNHIGRFVREYGENWVGEEVAIYARGYKDASYKRYYFKENGQLENWPYGFFG